MLSDNAACCNKYGIPKMKAYFCIAVNSAIVPDYSGEESPDSTEQRTGEEPGVPPKAEQQKVPQKITTVPDSHRDGKGENVG